MIRDGKGEINAEMFDLINNLDKVMKVIDLKMQYAVADNDKERQRIHKQANAIRATLPSDVADLIGADVSLDDSLKNIQNISTNTLINTTTSSYQTSYKNRRTTSSSSSKTYGKDYDGDGDVDHWDHVKKNRNYTKKYKDEIKRIARKHGVDMGVARDMHKTNRKLGYKKYHTGGFVGGKAFDPKHEEIAKLLKGELVLTPNHLNNFIRNISSLTPSINNKLNSCDTIYNYNFNNMTVKTNDARGFIKNLKTLTAM